MEESSFSPQVDENLLGRFDEEILSKTPHVIRRDGTGPIANPTPLVDLTDALTEGARVEYGIRMDPKTVRVFGKLDSQIFGGSVKVRPAVEIIRDAIATGKLRSGQKIFEATSGNFGLALGMLRSLGLEVIVLVSRRLQGGVLDELKNEGVRSVNLDVDICPAPGLKIDPNLVVAKAAGASVREQLARLGLDTSVFDNARSDVEAMLAKQDVINLAKLLAKIYDGFCPEQYDNELNVRSHETTTAPEIDQQLKAHRYSLGDFRIITAFGTGGTSAGLAKYAQAKYRQKPVHVVYPLTNQDVAGIRTRDKAVGLRFYQPELYGGEHEVDFEAARRLLRFFASRGHDIGESGALALYSALQMINYGAGNNFVVMIADGLQKYLADLDVPVETSDPLEVNVQEANSKQPSYGEVLWTHAMFVPREEGIKLVADALGCDRDKVKIATARDVQALITTEKIPAGINALLPKDKSKTLLVCMAGGTSLRVAEVLTKNGVGAQSLTGGIMNLSQTNNRQPEDLVQVATE
ncbi:MAG TPA: pyridoxal-phosphate dependent enzyme [Candidatus Dormibacteraeota bacterium]|nr:pyridoxal-phosphate dependent enzyme [Candidatus Dormibacteraeota bacterium]